MLYYWLRLSPYLAFYVDLISETLKDISSFLVIFLMCIAVFGNAFYALNGIKSSDFADTTTTDT
jgi:hypothetical protein